MKAVVFHDHGPLANVTLADMPMPVVGPDDVRVAIKAAALNRLDLWVLEGWPSLKLKLPHIMGSDGAGVIVETGRNVTTCTAGDRVAIDPSLSCGVCRYCISGLQNRCKQFAILGEHVDGFFAEYAVVPARNVVKMPENVTFEAAAAASLVYVTAWHSLIVRGGLRAGEDVLIIGAGGGVNTAAIQIARMAGAGTIYVVGSSDEKLTYARRLGADVTINRVQENWSKAVYRATERRGVDIVVDNVGAATFAGSLRALARGGRLLTVGNTSGPMFEIDNRLIFGKHLSIIGSTMGPHADYVTVMKAVFSGRLAPVIDSLYPLEEAPVALKRLAGGDVIGKLVLKS